MISLRSAAASESDDKTVEEDYKDETNGESVNRSLQGISDPDAEKTWV